MIQRALLPSKVSSIAVALAAISIVVVGGCRRTHPRDPAAPVVAGETAPPVGFEVRSTSGDLTFFWFDEHGNAHSVGRVEDVPAEHRNPVRVDPSRPELRQPGWVYVADLTHAGPDGRYPVRTIASEAFADQLAPLNGLAVAMAPARPPSTPQASPSGTPAAHDARVVIYGASWCGACHQAANYLRQAGIPFVEHDIEREPEAAQEMYARARQQGVPLGSIPIIDVGGRLMVGFNPEAIQHALRGS